MQIKGNLTFKELEKKTREVNDLNGWKIPKDAWKHDYIIPTKISLIHSEVSESLEAFRHRDFENFSEELADIIIRIFDLSSTLEINLQEEIEKKLEKNALRGFKHGNKKV